MKEMRISLNTIEKVKSFVDIISMADGDLDLVSGRYVINAKSTMGIFSLDLSKALTLRAQKPEELERIKEQLTQFTA